MGKRKSVFENGDEREFFILMRRERSEESVGKKEQENPTRIKRKKRPAVVEQVPLKKQRKQKEVETEQSL